MLERFLSPFPLVTTPAGHEMKALAQRSLSRKVSRHYGGFLMGVLREYRREAAEGVRKVKRLLYAYRVALTGIHLLLPGELVMDVTGLYERYGFERVPELIRIKTEREANTIQEADENRYLEDIERLEGLLSESVEKSVLPTEPTNRKEIEEFVIEQRLSL